MEVDEVEVLDINRTKNISPANRELLSIENNDEIVLSCINISELSRISKLNKPTVSRYFRAHPDMGIVMRNNRIVGVTPTAAKNFLREQNIDYIDQGGVVLVANVCGGVGKTSSAINLSCAAKRICGDDPIVLVDADPQASFTSMIYGAPAADDDAVLIDFLSDKASIDSILTPMGENLWFVKSNLNQIFLDKILDKPKEIKSSMLKFYNAIFDKLGNKTKIFQDHTPQLSSLLASSICAIAQLNQDILRSVLIPMRCDATAIRGANYILQEINELEDTFAFNNEIDTHCFFSGLDQRVSTTSQALRMVKDQKDIVEHLSPVVVRYSSELSKCINNSESRDDPERHGHINVFSRNKMNNAGEDYQDLLLSIFSRQ